MIVPIDNRDIVPIDKRSDRPQIGLVAGCIDESGFLPKEPGQLFLQFFMDRKIPI